MKNLKRCFIMMMTGVAMTSMAGHAAQLRKQRADTPSQDHLLQTSNAQMEDFFQCLMRQGGPSQEETERFRQFMNNSPRLSYDGFWHLVETIHQTNNTEWAAILAAADRIDLSDPRYPERVISGAPFNKIISYAFIDKETILFFINNLVQDKAQSEYLDILYQAVPGVHDDAVVDRFIELGVDVNDPRVVQFLIDDISCVNWKRIDWWIGKPEKMLQFNENTRQQLKEAIEQKPQLFRTYYKWCAMSREQLEGLVINQMQKQIERINNRMNELKEEYKAKSLEKKTLEAKLQKLINEKQTKKTQTATISSNGM